MAASTSDLLKKTGASTVTTLAAPGKALSATSITVGSTTNYPTDTGIVIAIRVVDSNGELVAGTYTEWSATVTSGTTLAIVAVPVYGSDQVYAAGSTTQVYIPLSAYAHNKLVDGFTAEHSQLDGTHTDVTADSIVVTGNVTAGSFTVSGAGTDNGWTVGLPTPNTVTNNGNRSYDLVFNANDITDTVSAGMRLRTTRTVTAPTQCADLEASSSQYFDKSSPAGMTFTDDFTLQWKGKLESYAQMILGGRCDATPANGYYMDINSSGQVRVIGYNASNFRAWTSYQSVPLNKRICITGQLDMSGFTSATCKIYFDGIEVPGFATNSGSPTAIVQAGNFSVGRGGSFAGQYTDAEVYEFAVFSSLLSAATIRSYASQSLIGNESTLVSAYNFNGNATDLNTTNANNLTAQGGATATTASSFYGNYLGGTLDYAIITKTAFSTNTTLTVQVPEGCTIPTSGGVSAVAYSTQSVPYGFVRDSNRWQIVSLYRLQTNNTSSATWTPFNSSGWALNVPIGAWSTGYEANLFSTSTTGVNWNMSPTVLTGGALAGGENILMSSAILTATNAAVAVNAVRLIISVQNTSSATYVMYTIGSTASAGVLGANSACIMFADCAYL